MSVAAHAEPVEPDLHVTEDDTCDLVHTEDGLAHPDTGVVVVPFRRGPLTISPDQEQPTEAQLSALEAIGIRIGGKGGFTMGAVMLLFQVAAATGLDPFKRQIWLIRTWNVQEDGSRQLEYSVMVGIHTMAGLARATGEHRGMEGPQFLLDPDEDTWVDHWPRGAEHPTAVRCRVFREGVPKEDTPWAIIYWDETVPMVHQFVPGPDGKRVRDASLPMVPHPRWQDRGIGLIAKCSHAAALRASFPDAIGALYIGEEMARAEQEAAAEDDAFERARDRADDRTRAADIRRLVEVGRGPQPDLQADAVVVGTVVGDSLGKADGAREGAAAARRAAEARVRGRKGPEWEDAPEEERIAWLGKELLAWSDLLDIPHVQLTEPLEGIFGAVTGWGVEELLSVVGALRPTVVQALSATGRHAEAAALAQVGTEIVAPLSYLLGQEVSETEAAGG
jgi:hypothetical protein